MSMMILDKKTSDLSMNDYETMREAKVAYNYINDILENSEVRMDSETAKELENSLEILGYIYSAAHSCLESPDREHQLLTDACCKNCNNNLFISENIEYSYQCLDCDENFYDFETNGDNVWYDDKTKEHLPLSNSFNINVEYDKNEKTVWIGSEDGSGATYHCKNADDFAKNMEFYCNNYLSYDEELEVENEK